MCQLPFSEDKTVINILFKCLSELSDATKSLINNKNKKHTPFRIIAVHLCQGRIQGGGGRTRRAPPPPPKIGKNMIFFWRKIVIFHMKYPKYFARLP
jgi:hypothetical protein